MTVMETDVPHSAASGNRLQAAALWLQASFIAERGRWFLWAPVFLGAGSSLYFVLTFEPPAYLLWLLTGTFLIATAVGIRIGLPVAVRLLLITGFLIALGLLAAQIRTLGTGTIYYNGPTTPVWVTGRVSTIELADRGARIVIDHPKIETFDPARTPQKIRLRLTSHSTVPEAGQAITVKAALMPPPGPAAPEAHDFRRDAYFAGIGAVGYAVSRAHSAEMPDTQAPTLERMRQVVAAHVRAALGNTQAAAIAIAYLTGERGLINDDTADDMRNSGLAHLLAISGMKVGLVAILVFSFARFSIALVPRLAVRIPTRKVAACLGIAAAIFYTGLADAPVPALRSVLMTGMAMLAILFDRPAFSLRLAAIAAIIVILWQPDSVIGVSFQMSFGAVIALIAFYESFREDVSRLYRGSGRVRRTLLGFGKLLVTTLVATLVTAPLALFHFQQEANYSIIANALAIPLNDFWIMPSAIVGMVLMPFGLDAAPFRFMGKGIEAMLAIAGRVSHWPYAVTHAATLPGYALPFLIGGGLWVIIWKRPWRRLGFIPIACGVALACFYPHPKLFVSEDAGRIGVVLDNGRLAVSKIGRRDFTADSWDRLNGAHGAIEFPDTGSFDKALSCTADLCVYSVADTGVAILRAPAAVSSACSTYPIIISPFVVTSCAAKTVIDPVSLKSSGAVALYIDGSGYRLDSVRAESGVRPWSNF